jgi:flavin-dependent dehydrogenase
MKEHDVVVVGGGLAGVACALTLARRGREVLLVERRPALGWESTMAGQLEYRSTSPLAGEIVQEMERVGGVRGNTLDGPILEMLLDRMVRDAGVRVLLYSFPLRLIFGGNAALGVVIGGRGGERIVRGRAVVDATEEALLWRQTEIPRRDLGPVPGRYSFFMNNGGGDLDLPLDLGDGIVIKPSVWRGEARIECEVAEASILPARTRLPDAIRRVREVPQLKEALITHAANEVFPSSPSVWFQDDGIIHPMLPSLHGCGIWAVEAENTPAGRIALGERVAAVVDNSQVPSDHPAASIAGSVLPPSEMTGEVIVVGGGTGGAIAAIAAAREGMKTVLIEATNSLGGIGTAGAIHSYYYGLTGGIQDEVDARTAEITPLFCGRWDVRGFHPEAKKLVLHEMAQEAGVEIHLDTIVTGVRLAAPVARGEGNGARDLALRDGGVRRNLAGVLTASARGAAAYGARVFIDGTGDGDVAAMSGVPFILGRERDNICHTYSQVAGRLDPDTRGLRHLNFDAGYVDPTDVEDMTRGRRSGIQLYWQETFTEENRILYIAPLLGVRQGRQILGEYQLTFADEIAGRRFEDAVSFTESHYDNHGYDYENESDEAALWVWALGNWKRFIGCEVPYRCLLPFNLDGLLIGSRALSMTYDAHHAFRMQRDIQRIGEVAALAAAQAIRQGVEPRRINVKELQSKLRQRGILDERHRPKPAIRDGRTPGPVAGTTTDPDTAKEMVWLAVRDKEAGLPALRDALKSPDPDIRFKASVALATLGTDEGISALLRYVKDRASGMPEGVRTVPLWQAAIPFLGIAGDRRSVPTLVGVLGDRRAPLDALVASVRSLARIGDAEAVPAIRDVLKRGDLPIERTLRGTAGVRAAVEDARWQIEIAAAEAMGRLGAPADEVWSILRPHLDDHRAYVRRYAGRVLREAGIVADREGLAGQGRFQELV